MQKMLPDGRSGCNQLRSVLDHSRIQRDLIANSAMFCGVDQLFSGGLGALRRRLRDARVGVVTHAAAVDRRGRHLLVALDELGAAPSVVFSPEHGLDGVAQAEEAVAGTADAAASPVVSLYGDTRESLSPSQSDLERCDIVLIDVADVGSRYYTYVWTALLAARAAAARGIHVVVLDRPNPISGNSATLEGASQHDGFTSFVGLEPVPIRHASTVGELLALFVERDGHALGPDGALSVVATEGWERHQTAQAWGRPFAPPSPNMPTLETALVYPGGCLIEGTNLSEGRGTTLPFQLVGAPFIDGDELARGLTAIGVPGAQVRAVRFRPTWEKHAGQVCSGVLIQVTEPALFRPVSAYLALIALARAQAPEAFAFRTEAYEFEREIPAFDLLTGSAAARTALEQGACAEDVVALVAPADPAWRDVLAEAEPRLARARAN
jgi:uncharacterized protein YbbC (DUF1343 family)